MHLSVQSHAWSLALLSHVLMNVLKFLWVVQSTSVVKNNSRCDTWIRVIHSGSESSVSVSRKVIEQRLKVVPMNGVEAFNVIWYANNPHNETFWGLFLFFSKHCGKTQDSQCDCLEMWSTANPADTWNLPGPSGAGLCGEGRKLKMHTSEQDYQKSPSKSSLVPSQQT